MHQIEGFKLHIETAEMAKLLHARADYHTRRAATKEAELPQLKALLERIKANPEDRQALKAFNGSYATQEADPIGSLERDIRNHKARAVKFDFYATHLASNATYVLDGGEASRLELLNEEEV